MVEAARVLVEESGIAALTMRALAEHLGIKAPSLYKHFPDKAAVEVELIALSLIETARAMEEAEERFERSGPAEFPSLLTALAATYRADALAHPHLYCLATEGPLPRHALPEGLEERAALPLLRACDFDMDRARAVWAFAHGMVILEIHGRFPDGADLTGAWRAGIGALER
ncbi:TetR/AcrR family transcriptional regulator [Streptomyces sp. NPDC004610]|uniref:TetR/AcrR family transcriptional regulator n=1 Tax=unclassified Streptomyces TaxID=2593676 RepID=UPI0033A3E05E